MSRSFCTCTLSDAYDDYDFTGDVGFTDDRFVNDTSGHAKGSLTGTVMNVYGSSEKIYMAYYYDAKGRVKKTVENNLMGGYNTTETTYTFTDQPATVTLTHTASGKLTQTEVYTYSYDHSDRISSVTHKLNSNTAVTLASYTYDNKGRMATKKLHGSSTNQVTYAYNIRSWITGINSNKFTQNLTYNNGSTGFNGNITGMNWTANGASHSYSFTYDGLNRMLNATHGTGAYTEKVTEYDKNGNIKYLYRYNNGSLVDNLTYDYNGNQLTKVEDATGNTAGFKNGASQANEYTYDNNGNLTKDLNKGITNISYNSLSLPQVVTFSNGNTITYLYTADGRKLRTVHVINGTATTTDYCGNVIYENGTQKLLLTEEGYIDLANGNAYYYYLKDHQGNNRVVLSSSGTVMETNHYYPFGGVFSISNVQPYKYNGKEQDTKAGLNWYDYGARHYDAALGRWFVVDPLAEKYYSSSPFVYCGNNPINRIDPTGMEWEDDEEAERLKRKVKKKMQSLKRKNDKKQSKLDKGGLSDKKVKRLKAKIAENQERISHLQTSLNDIDILGNDKNNVYALSKTDGGEHHVRKAEDGRVLIETSSDAISLHEISHVRQSLNSYGKLLFSPNGYLYNAGRTSAELFSKMVIEAYRIQYSYDLSFPGNLYKKGIQGIDAKSVGNIYNPNTGKYVYEIIHKYSLKLK